MSDPTDDLTGHEPNELLQDAAGADGGLFYDYSSLSAEETSAVPGLLDSMPAAAATMHGDPVWAETWMQYQGQTNDCLPYSVAMVVYAETGQHVDGSEVATFAQGLGLLGPDGMSFDQGVTLLDHYGIDAHTERGTIETLESYLDQKRGIIVFVDADEVAKTPGATTGNDDAFDLGAGQNHALVVTGIDESTGLVYFNDPATGEKCWMTISDFNNAWADSGNDVIVTDETSVTPTSTESWVDSLKAEPSSPDDGFQLRNVAWLVPIVVAGAAIARFRG